MLHLIRFRLPGCGDIALFRTVPWLTQIHQTRNYFPPKNHVLLSNVFSSSNMLFIRLFLANTWEDNRGSPCLCRHKLLWKVDMVLRSQSGGIICAAGTGARNKITPIVFEVCTRDQACFRLFLCVFDIANTEIHTWKECTNNKEWGKSRFDEILKLWTFSFKLLCSAGVLLITVN